MWPTSFNFQLQKDSAHQSIYMEKSQEHVELANAPMTQECRRSSRDTQPLDTAHTTATKQTFFAPLLLVLTVPACKPRPKCRDWPVLSPPWFVPGLAPGAPHKPLFCRGMGREALGVLQAHLQCKECLPLAPGGEHIPALPTTGSGMGTPPSIAP